jgi:peptidyl-prolyl cis-trans isomerase C
MSMPTLPNLPQEPMKIEMPPKITELADMYNNTISTTIPETSSSTTNDNATESSKEPPLHIPQKPEDYLPSIFIKEEPPHGCLKNGKKPTFREWVTKILGGGGPPGVPSPHDGGAMSGGAMSGGAMSGGAMSGGAMSGGAMSGGAMSGGDIDPTQIAGMRVKIRKTHKKRYRIGKHDNVVGVLLKNKQTQRHIQSQHLKLRQSSIGEIRKYLYDHHLLKIGSNAPPDVLRRMYEDAILTGDVKNTNDGVMLHNFMSGGGE